MRVSQHQICLSNYVSASDCTLALMAGITYINTYVTTHNLIYIRESGDLSRWKGGGGRGNRKKGGGGRGKCKREFSFRVPQSVKCIPPLL